MSYKESLTDQRMWLNDRLFILRLELRELKGKDKKLAIKQAKLMQELYDVMTERDANETTDTLVKLFFGDPVFEESK